MPTEFQFSATFTAAIEAKVAAERSRKVFLALAGEEQAHLERMASFLERYSGKG